MGFQPKYETAKRSLLRRVESMAPGTKLPTIQTLRKQLGVSQGTIMRAIVELAEDGVIERRLNRGAFVATRNHARNILVIWPDLVECVTEQPLSVHPFTSRILHSVQEASGLQSQNLLITRKLVAEHPEHLLDSNRVSGVIVLFNYDRKMVESYVERGIPTVLIEPLLRVQGVPFVTSDHCADTREATMRLILRGHTRIVYIAMDQHLQIPDLEGHREIVNFVVEERVRGYCLAMREAGLENLIHVHYGPGRLWDEKDRQALFSVIRTQRVTACCCFNDDIAARVYHTCREHELSIPEDLSVIGHDDGNIAKSIQPGLTTIHSPLQELGHCAMQLLNQQIESRQLEGPGMILASPLKERESVATWDEAASNSLEPDLELQESVK